MSRWSTRFCTGGMLGCGASSAIRTCAGIYSILIKHIKYGRTSQPLRGEDEGEKAQAPGIPRCNVPLSLFPANELQAGLFLGRPE